MVEYSEFLLTFWYQNQHVVPFKQLHLLYPKLLLNSLMFRYSFFSLMIDLFFLLMSSLSLSSINIELATDPVQFTHFTIPPH